MMFIRLLISLIVLSSLAAPELQAQDRLTACDGRLRLSTPAEDPLLAKNVPGEVAFWVAWHIESNQYVVAVSRDAGVAWVTMINDFERHWDPDLLPPEDRPAAIARAPKPHTNVYKDRISEDLAKELSMAWTEWLSEAPGESGLGRSVGRNKRSALRRMGCLEDSP